MTDNTAPATEGVPAMLATIRETVGAIRARIVEVDERLQDREIELNRLKAEPPHTDDIVETFRRGLDASATRFRSQFKAHLRHRYDGIGAFSNGSAGTNARATLQLLTLETKQPEMPGAPTLPPTGMSALNLDVLAYLLRDKIEADLPAMVDDLHPEGRNGMREVERRSAINAVEREIAALKALTGELREALGKTRAAVAGEVN